MKLNEVNARVLRICREHFPDRHPVLGEGREGCTVMFIGEAPGAQEEEQGRPFVGKAGRNLDEFLETAGIERADVYIGNAVKIRPVKISPKGTVSNRTPTAREIELFASCLADEIEAVSPKVIVTLGNTPLRAVAGKNIRIGDVHGEMREHAGRYLYPMYHPASVIYDRSLKDVYISDVKRLGEILREWKMI